MSPVCVLSGTREFLEISTLLFVLDTRRPIIVNRVFCGMFLSSATRTIDLLLRYSKRFAFRYLHRFFFTCARAVRSVSVVFLWHVCVSRYQDNRPCYCGVQKASPFEITCFFFLSDTSRQCKSLFVCVRRVIFLPFFLQRTVVTMDRLRAFDPVSMRPCGVLAF